MWFHYLFFIITTNDFYIYIIVCFNRISVCHILQYFSAVQCTPYNQGTHITRLCHIAYILLHICIMFILFNLRWWVICALSLVRITVIYIFDNWNITVLLFVYKSELCLELFYFESLVFYHCSFLKYFNEMNIEKNNATVTINMIMNDRYIHGMRYIRRLSSELPRANCIILKLLHFFIMRTHMQITVVQANL